MIILFLFRPIVWLVAPTKVTGKQNVKALKETGFIVIADHSSYMDPVTVGLSIGYRRLRFMAKESLFRGPFGWLIKALGAFPVKRGKADTKAIKTAMKTVNDGHACLIFPEGKRNQEHELLPFEKGVAFITMQCKVPVLPMYISKKRHHGRILVTIGEPIDIVELSKQFEKSERLEKLTEHLQNSMVALQKEQENSLIKQIK